MSVQLSRRQVTALLLVLGVAVVLLVGSLWPVAQAAPGAAPTPISNVVASDSGNYFVVIDRAVSASANFQAPASLASFEWADWQYAIDQGTPVNTTTLTLEYSNDGVNWVTGPALVSANVADADDLVRLPLFGRYARVAVTQTGTQSVGIDVNLLAK